MGSSTTATATAEQGSGLSRPGLALSRLGLALSVIAEAPQVVFLSEHVARLVILLHAADGLEAVLLTDIGRAGQPAFWLVIKG